MSRINASVPGSIMLMGEHAVLFGHRAIACAVDKYINVSLNTRSDRQVSIQSALANYQSNLDQLKPEPALSFMLAALDIYRNELPSGIDLVVEAGFSHTVGLGSSAAVTVATVAVLRAAANLSVEPEDIFNDALAVVKKVQGRGSGTDLAASVYGGLIAYTVDPRQVTKLPGTPQISLYYSGYKMRTPDVLRHVEQRSQNQKQLYRSLYQLMHETTVAAEQVALTENWSEFGRLMDIYQGLMDALGVCDATLSEMIYTLRGSELISGAKISGSGLGDCVLALGSDLHLSMPYEQIPVNVSNQGVKLEYL